MSKNSTLPAFEDYKAPWEVNSDGTEVPADEQNLDPAKLKKKLYDVLQDRQRLVSERESIKTELTQVKADLDTAVRKGEGAEEKSAREAQEALEKARAEGAAEALRLEVALDIEGITPAQAKRLAKRLAGSTREELEADAKAVAEDFGIGKSTDSGEPASSPSGRPQRLRASGDPEPDSVPLPSPRDINKVNELFPRR